MCFQDYVVALGCPTGSVLDPLLFSISQKLFVTSHANIHTSADDTWLYLSFNVSDGMSECLKKMEKCVGEIREWKTKYILNLNDEKIEVLVISTPYFTDRQHEIQLRISDASVQASESLV